MMGWLLKYWTEIMTEKLLCPYKWHIDQWRISFSQLWPEALLTIWPHHYNLWHAHIFILCTTGPKNRYWKAFKNVLIFFKLKKIVTLWHPLFIKCKDFCNQQISEFTQRVLWKCLCNQSLMAAVCDRDVLNLKHHL